jgi:hypothetical protein
MGPGVDLLPMRRIFPAFFCSENSTWCDIYEGVFFCSRVWLVLLQVINKRILAFQSISGIGLWSCKAWLRLSSYN